MQVTELRRQPGNVEVEMPWVMFLAEIDMQLLGEHQRENAVTAIGAALALRRQGFHRLNLTSITAGLCSATLPGRFQV